MLIQFSQPKTKAAPLSIMLTEAAFSGFYDLWGARHGIHPKPPFIKHAMDLNMYRTAIIAVNNSNVKPIAHIIDPKFKIIQLLQQLCIA